MFQVVIVLFTLSVAMTIAASFLVGAAIVFAGWWLGLACVASQPTGGAFLRERQYFGRLLEEQTSMSEKRIVQLLFYGLYWPILISKNAYFVLIVGAGVIYYTIKFLRDY